MTEGFRTRKEIAMRRKLTGVLVNAVVFMVASGLAAAQAGSKAATVEPVTGKQIYSSYCALCHGSDAKGGGPFAAQLKVWPPDLTQLAKKNHGAFPEMRVSETIDGEFGKPSHGNSEMPIWGPVFRSMAHGHKDNAQLRIKSLVKYLESVQEK
jgi:mono/diheme cytochrome c family protein